MSQRLVISSPSVSYPLSAKANHLTKGDGHTKDLALQCGDDMARFGIGRLRANVSHLPLWVSPACRNHPGGMLTEGDDITAVVACHRRTLRAGGGVVREGGVTSPPPALSHDSGPPWQRIPARSC